MIGTLLLPAEKLSHGNLAALMPINGSQAGNLVWRQLDGIVSLRLEEG